MTLTVRNNTLKLILGAILLLGAGFGTLLVFALLNFSEWPSIFKHAQTVLHFPVGAEYLRLSIVLVTSAFFLIFAFRQTYNLYVRFSRILSAELFFYQLFLASFAFEAVRVGSLAVLLFNQPLVVGVVQTRIVFFGFMFGTLSAMVGSLYAAGVKSKSEGSVALLIGLVSLVFTSVVPIDMTTFTGNFLFKVSDRSVILIISVVFIVLTLMSLIRSAVGSGNRDAWKKVLSLTGLMVSRELVIFAPQSLFILPVAIILWLSAWLFRRTLQEQYFWT